MRTRPMQRSSRLPLRTFQRAPYPPSGRSLALAVALALAASGCGEDPLPSGIARSAIVVTCDTLRADHVGAYGGRDLTPNLDAFARGSIVFDAAYSSAPLTSPALTTLMTGRTPDELGMRSNKVVAPAAVMTIAEAARFGGLQTAAIVSNFVLRKRPGQADAGLEQGFDHYDDTMEDVEANRANVRERLAASTTDAALAWLDEKARDRFFLWVHYQDPHGPYTPPTSYEREWTRGDEPELRVGTTQKGLNELPAYQAIGSERHPDFYRSRYDAEIRYFDAEVGRLFDALDERGYLDDSLVVFTADHGESLGEHGWWFSHGQTVYDELVRVPFVVRYPRGAARPNTVERDGFERVDTLVGHLDVFATVVAALGVSGVPTHGASLLAEELPTERIVPQNLREPGAGDRWESITDGRYRLIANADGVALYDLVEDPGETTDVAAENPEVVRNLVDRYEVFQSNVPEVGAEAIEDELTPDQREAMDKLGYTGHE